MSRPAVLLLHGMPLDARMWDGVRPALEEAGYEVVAPDLPGDEPLRGLESWAERVLGLVQGRFVPVGSSMGGYLSFELLRQAPERVAGLVLAGSRAAPDTPEERAARDDAIRTVREQGVETFWDGLAPRLFSPEADPAAVARARELALVRRPEILVATLETLRDRPDSRPTLAAAGVPVLVLAGEDDVVAPPAEAEEMAASAGGRLVRLAGAGHLLPLERPAEVAREVLAFLGEVTA